MPTTGGDDPSSDPKPPMCHICAVPLVAENFYVQHDPLFGWSKSNGYTCPLHGKANVYRHVWQRPRLLLADFSKAGKPDPIFPGIGGMFADPPSKVVAGWKRCEECSEWSPTANFFPGTNVCLTCVVVDGYFRVLD